ncbi:hypothetical protein ACMD2_23479 [Ananas comosus]|uniref:Uncharacterized protein n=1 Tax=Ananas comosus TaxID=4615 RepID=A0A199UTR8_ANACO|nr:hypothetical protein ACMD2_23479 [Ananas comosus]
MNAKHGRTIMNSKMWKLRQGENDILPTLQLSNQYLSPHLKRCFSVCSSFPKDDIILRRLSNRILGGTSKFLFISHLGECLVYPFYEDINIVWERLLERRPQSDGWKAQTLVAANWWMIWRDRNNVISRNLPTDVSLTTYCIGVLAKEWAEHCKAG